MKNFANWQLIVCGISHKGSDIRQREPLQIGHDQIARANTIFGSLPGVMESVIVSTCNRAEFYFVWDRQSDPFEIVKSFYSHLGEIDISNLKENFYIKKGKHAMAHLFDVAAGLDSMVFGENQILGQLKDAYSSACAVKTAGKVIHRLFHQAFRAGKQVRTDTEMGKGTCSVSTAAVGLLKSKIDKKERPSILFIGVNQMIALAASGLTKIHHGQFSFANRTVEKAADLAAKYGATHHSLDELPALLGRVDIVFTSTGSELPIISREMIDSIIARNPRRFEPGGKKLVIMDLALPRDVEIGNDYHPAIDVYDLGDIQRHVENLQKRQEEAMPQAREIIERRLEEFEYWYDHVRHEPIYNGLDNTFETIRLQEMEGILKRLPSDLRDEVGKATSRLVNRLLQVKIRTSENRND